MLEKIINIWDKYWMLFMQGLGITLLLSLIIVIVGTSGLPAGDVQTQQLENCKDPAVKYSGRHLRGDCQRNAYASAAVFLLLYASHGVSKNEFKPVVCATVACA